MANKCACIDGQMSRLASRKYKVKLTDSQGFVLAMDLTNKDDPIIKSFFWGVGDDPDLGRALTVNIVYCPICGRKLR